MEMQRTWNGQNVIKKKKERETKGVALVSYLKTFSAPVIKTMWYQPTGRQMDRGDRIQSLEIDPHVYG